MLRENNESDLYSKIPQEKIFVHYNSAFLISGEQLLYKIYCTNSKTAKLSNLSKIAYVELVDQNQKVHFKHKIKLTAGLGQGDFFIPANLTSGNYKLIAYTKWMRDGGKNNFFHGDLSLLNPFSFKPSISAIKNDTLDNHKVEDLNPRQIGYQNEVNKKHVLTVLPNKNQFSNREKVIVDIRSENGEMAHGNYSISVKKIADIPKDAKLTAITYESVFTNVSQEKK